MGTTAKAHACQSGFVQHTQLANSEILRRPNPTNEAYLDGNDCRERNDCKGLRVSIPTLDLHAEAIEEEEREEPHPSPAKAKEE